MFAQTGVKIVPLTRKFAKEFSDLPAYSGDRNRETTVGRARIAWLERLVNEGKFHSPKWATAKLGKEVYRVNGGHSSYMLSSLNGNFPTGLRAVVEEFQCDTDRDLAELFSQFDNRFSVRSDTDKIRAHIAVEESLGEVSPTDTRNAIRGIAFAISSGGDGSRLEPDEVIGLVHTHSEFILWARCYMRKRLMRGAPCAGAIYSTYSVDEDDARVFWDLVMEENHENPEHPTRKLARFLRDQISKDVKHVDGRGVYAKCIHAWNAYRQRLGTDLKYFPKSDLPRPK